VRSIGREWVAVWANLFLLSPFGSTVLKPNLDSGFCKSYLHCHLLSRKNIGIVGPRERPLQLFKLKRGEGRPIASLLPTVPPDNAAAAAAVTATASAHVGDPLAAGVLA